MSAQRTIGEAWIELADLEELQRESLMVERYLELAGIPEDERQEQLRAIAPVEYALPEDKIQSFHRSRLRTWLRMDPAAARRIATSYDAVMQQLPGEVGMRRVSIVQTIARSLSLAEQEQLHVLVPHVFGETSHPTGETTDRRQPTAAVRARRPWWAFWRRD